MCTAEVHYLQYNFLSAEQIIAESVCEVNTYKYVGVNSVYDARMGTSHHVQECATCYQNISTCPGHIGHIRLEEPIINCLARTHVRDWLKVVCITCARPIVDLQYAEQQYQKSKRNVGTFFEFVVSLCDRCRLCHHCSETAPILDVLMEEKPFTIHHNRTTKRLKSDVPVRTMIGRDIDALFRRIPASDLTTLGVEQAPPFHLLLTILPVMPPVARSSVHNGTYIADDDITSQYIKLLKTVNALRRCRDKFGPIEDQPRLFGERISDTYKRYVYNLEREVRTLIGSNRNGRGVRVQWRMFKSIKDRLTGKEGHFRSNIMGKRVDFSARSVITPNPTIPVDVVGVPREIAKELTIPERVTRYNLYHIVQLLAKGNVRSIIRNGVRYNMQIAKATSQFKSICIGDIVERFLTDGDLVLLNRQPTLHTGSMIAQRVQLVNERTLQLSLAITRTFNADFDGDEMNIHVPQSVDCRAELELCSTLEHMFINPQKSIPFLSIVQDSLLGVYLLTQPSCMVSFENAQQLLIAAQCDTYPSWNQTVRISGKDVFSELLPDTFSYEFRNNALEVDGYVCIENGCLKSGTITKSAMNDTNNSIILAIYHTYGAKRVLRFIDQIQLLATEYTSMYGFSIRLQDCIAETKHLKASVRMHLLQCNVATNVSHAEFEINMHLNRAKDLGHKLARECLPMSNAFKDCIYSGSKGNFVNLTQITGLLGQQNVSGQRIQTTISHGRRTLPHYPLSIETSSVTSMLRMYESRGFIRHSFMEGLNSQEYFFHACSGREGVTDTACKTSIPGYLQRQKVKLMEDLHIAYDQTVRAGGANAQIVQFRYGGDGYSPDKLIRNGRSSLTFVTASELRTLLSHPS